MTLIDRNAPRAAERSARNERVVPHWCHQAYAEGVDVNVKNVDPEVLARLAEQAEAEGMSQQEWIRQTLRRTAARLSPAELVAQHTLATDPMTDAEFSTIQRRVAERRRAALDQLFE